MSNADLTVSLIIATYNAKEVLRLVLETALAQTIPPGEIVIADDGSDDDTAETIRAVTRNTPVPILHAWQPNEGFRLARSRNNAVAVSSGEYLIFLDGDCFLNPWFIEDHLSFARQGQFVVGTRINIQPSRQEYILRTGDTKISLWSWGTHKKINAIRWRWLSRFFVKGGMAGANFAAWRSDVIRVNGFNEAFVGHGGEDTEIALRLEMAGLVLRKMRYAGMAYHFAHSCNVKGDRTRIGEIIRETMIARKTWCDAGLDRAFEEKEILLRT